MPADPPIESPARRRTRPLAVPVAFASRRIPAWVLSVLLHTVIVGVLGTAWKFQPRGVATEPDRTTGIVLVRKSQGEREYFDQDDLVATDQVNDGAIGSASPLPSADELKLDMSSLLPQEAEGAGSAGEAAESSAPRSGDLGGGTAKGLDVGGSARTGVFGVYGEGSRFVYVFDRSGSMDGYGGRPLRAAKSELLASLGDLGRIHQFQIIFYNESPRVFNPQGGRPRLEWADDASKQLARAFVNNISAAGGTRHMGALQLALGMKPDVIFFLTDADEPKMSAADLARVSRNNGGTMIHTVEFGFGRQRNRNNFLARLAEQNQGQHIYVDIAELDP